MPDHRRLFLPSILLPALLLATPFLLSGPLIANAFAQSVVDPLRPPPRIAEEARRLTRPAAPEMRLSATRVSAAGNEAVINGRRVTEGERLYGLLVLEIRPALVRLRDDEGGEIILGFADGEISIRPAEDSPWR